MKRFIAVIVLLFSISIGSQAVLKENGLARTLSVLRAELKYACEQQQRQMDAYELQAETLHQQLVSYMTRSEQVGLMLYSNNLNNSFGVAYSCAEAEKLRNNLEGTRGDLASYNNTKTITGMEIEKYRSLVRTLKNIPPVDKEDESHVMTMGDSLLLVALDSLSLHMSDSFDSVSETSMSLVSLMKGNIPEKTNEPLVLTGEMLEDRAACVEYAQKILENLEKYKASLERDNVYYEGVKGKVEELNAFSDSCYVMLQKQIYYTYDDNPFNLLSNIQQTKEALVKSWYDNFSDMRGLFDEGEEEQLLARSNSDWRGYQMLFLSVFFILYLYVARILSGLALRFIFRDRIRRDEEFRHKLYVLRNIVAYVLMILLANGLFLANVGSNYMVRYSMPLIINYNWVALAVMLSLYAKLDGRKLEEVIKIYTPFLDLSFVVTLIRMVLCPDIWINVVFPPVILIFTLAAVYRSVKYCHELDVYDSVLIWYTTGTMVFGTVLALMGTSLYSLLEMFWWCLQLGCIMTIRWVHYMAETKIRFVQQYEWFNVLFTKCIIPILYVISIPFCFYMSADVISLTPYCDEVFYTNYIDEPDMIQVSLVKVFEVTIMWFIFRYLANVCRWVYEKLHQTANKGSNAKANMTLVRNVIAILVWGLYFITVLVIFRVPKSGISVVTAGLATGLGFAMKGLIENFVYGLSLMTGRLRVGDNIECDGVAGVVESISYQNTQIATYDGCIVSFLNSDLFTKNFKNLTRNHNFVRESIKVGVAYGSDVALVRDVIYEAMQVLGEIPGANGKPICDFKRFPVSVVFSDFGDSSLDFEVRAWARIPDRMKLRTEARKAIYEAFKKNNITIPFPQRDVHMIKD